MLLVVVAPVADADEASGALWTSGVVSAVVEGTPAPDLTELRAAVRDGSPAATVDALVAQLAARWSVAQVDDAAERVAVVEAVRATTGLVRAGERIVVVPPWCTYDPRPGEVVVELDPGLTFGSGTHATTRMALAGLEASVLRGARVLDVGSGSGVLAVAAARLGAGRVVAVDIDPHAAATTAANVARNGAIGLVSVLTGDLVAIDPARPFDVVVANLSAGTLVDQASDLVARVDRAGVVLVTGILDDRAPEVVAAMTDAGARVTETRSEDGWTLLEARRRDG